MQNEKVRKPAVSGTFYPKDKTRLEKNVEDFIKNARIEGKDAQNAVSFVAPHAGYQYSGATAGFTYKALSARLFAEKAETFVIIGPNHTGYGMPLSLSGKNWMTPLGMVNNDIEFTHTLPEYSDLFSIEEDAHKAEHSIEVQLPFLQHVVRDPKCVFLCMGDQSYESSVLVADALVHAEEKLKRKTIVIASSDFNHYESASIAKDKDMKAIKVITSLNPKRFVELIEELNDSACGYSPIAAAALYAKSKGATKGELLNYSNSGDVTNDYGSVVAYASIAFL
jgi:AmmeMemoRadiSam system protein B